MDDVMRDERIVIAEQSSVRTREKIKSVSLTRRAVWATAGLLLACCDAGASEVCGLQNAVFDGIFVDGFNVPGSGLGPAYGVVNAPASGVTPAISITSPTGGSLPKGRVQVVGTVSGPPNVGVVVNGQRAYVFNGTFLTPELTLDPSQTSLVAEATAPDGLSASASRSITVSTTDPDAALSVDAEVGFSPLPVRFSASVKTGLTVQSFSVDFQTDGTPDYTGSGPIPATTYAAPGIYTASVTVTLSDSTTRTAAHKVIALDLAEHRADICSVYANLRARLLAQDANGAVRSLTGQLRKKLLSFFNALGSQMSTVAPGLGTLADGIIGLDTADLVAVKDASGTLRGYPVHMVRDRQGVWRIDAM
ncbi:MAG TPA: PKD domain-containing protein [Tahibacter sp.]|uniref:PKD domain-containing protein n=1 Tax=Tahibacter sp. TaxID=2056211 RepID=UPI002C5617A0|nr:PKD domain-containing protein [Tahibacter sp.]HSX60818.1 PKD domain-containing protein [Tahibacter sp.]